MNTFRKAFVYIRDRYAGLLEETDDGYRFQYDAEYLQKDPRPVSLTLPLADEPYTSKTLFPFFDGLIPEGWLLEVVTHNWKIEKAPLNQDGTKTVSNDSSGRRFCLRSIFQHQIWK